MNTCCGIPYAPEWKTETDGDFAFISVCPKCAKPTECAPKGADMQALHRITRNGGSPPPAPAKPEEPAVSLEESTDAALAIRIMSDFKDWHRRADRTIQMIEAKLQECVGRCQAEMKHVPTRDKAIEGFGMMIARAQEFTVEEDDGANTP